MADENLLNEFTALANGELNTQDYANDMLDVLRQTVQKKYIDKFYALLEEYKEQSRDEIGNELQLIEAFKPFFKDGSRGQIDNMTDMFSSMIAMMNLLNDVTPNAFHREPSNYPYNRQYPGAANQNDYYQTGNNPFNANLNGMNPMMLMLLMLFGM